MKPQYTLDKIKFSTDQATYQRALALYEADKIKSFEIIGDSYRATAQGTKLYNIIIWVDEYDSGECDCYLGQREILCKHIIAAAIYAIFRGEKLSAEEKRAIYHPECSNQLGDLSTEDLKNIKKQINYANRFIKYYDGPSRVWFAYQDSLNEGTNRLSAIISKLPVGYQTANLLVRTLLKIDKKLSFGVDDSNGIVGDFILGVVKVLEKYAELDPDCIRSFKQLRGISTTFDWEKSLVEIYEKFK